MVVAVAVAVFAVLLVVVIVVLPVCDVILVSDTELWLKLCKIKVKNTILVASHPRAYFV